MGVSPFKRLMNNPLRTEQHIMLTRNYRSTSIGHFQRRAFVRPWCLRATG